MEKQDSLSSEVEEKVNIKKERFKKLAEQRTNTILKTLRLLGNCSNKNNYQYTDKDIKKIFTAIEKELRNTKNKFEELEEEDFKL